MVAYKVLVHSSIRFDYSGIIIYFDPFKIQGNPNDADLIFITHSHYDHYSIEDIRKVDNGKTLYIMPETMIGKIEQIPFKRRIIGVKQTGSYEANGIYFQTVPAYNIQKPFHKKEFGWVGYIITLDNQKYYIMGDTDDTKEAEQVKADVVFAPVGGTYTMDANDAAHAVNMIHPKIGIPIHYGLLVGDQSDAKKFSSLLDSGIASDIEL